jgi:hypothetical protein
LGKLLTTFGEKAALPIGQMTAKVPSISKVVVSLDELDAIAFGQA